MKKNIAYIILLISLLVNATISLAQETRVTGTLKVHPWLDLPVVISTDIKGGLQSLGTQVDFTGKTISEVLNTAFPKTWKREIGMVATVVDAATNKTRYFEYYADVKWLEIYVITSWVTGRNYTIGDYVAIDGNYYIANVNHASSPAFATDALKWDNAGGKDGKYTIKEIKMDGATLNKVATSSSVVTAGTEDNTIATVGYALNAAFDGKRAVTRTGLTGISGVNFNTATLAEFLNKVFFPSRSPYVNYFRYNDVQTAGMVSYQTVDPISKVTLDNVGTVNVPYAVWSPLANFTFKYNIELQDPSTITKVEIINPATSTVLDTKVDGALVGSFTIPRSSGYTVLKMRITDSALNEVNLNLNTVFTLPLGVQISNVRLSASSGGAALVTSEGGGLAANPWLIERTGADLSYHLNWTMTKNNDANVTNIDFVGSPVLGNLAGASLTQETRSPVILPNADAATIFRLGVKAKGDVAQVYSDVSSSSYYQLRDKLYCGFLPSANDKPTEAQILALQKSSLSTTEYFSTRINPVPPDDATESGVTLVNTTGASGFFAWAVPTYNNGAAEPAPGSFSKYTYAFAFGSWNPYSEGFDRTSYFVKTSGANATWYWVTIYNASVANGNNVKALLQN